MIEMESPEETDRRKMGIHLGGDSKKGGGIRGDGRIYPEKVEHGHAVHSYAIASEPV